MENNDNASDVIATIYYEQQNRPWDNASDVVATIYYEQQNRPWDNASDVVAQSFDGASTHDEDNTINTKSDEEKYDTLEEVYTKWQSQPAPEVGHNKPRNTSCNGKRTEKQHPLGSHTCRKRRRR